MGLLVLGGCRANITDKDIKPIAMPELKRLMDEPPSARAALLIDPRAPSDYAAGHIPRARNVQMSDVSGRPGETDPALEPYGTLIVYGEDPGSPIARAMTKKLMSTGYSKVRMYFGGLREWAAAKYPVETSGE